MPNSNPFYPQYSHMGTGIGEAPALSTYRHKYSHLLTPVCHTNITIYIVSLYEKNWKALHFPIKSKILSFRYTNGLNSKDKDSCFRRSSVRMEMFYSPPSFWIQIELSIPNEME